VLCAAWAVDRVHEATGEGGLVEEGVVWAEEVVSISDGTMMVDLGNLEVRRERERERESWLVLI